MDTGRPPQEVEWHSATAAADLLGVSQRTIRRAIARAALPANKRAGVYRIAPEVLSYYREQREHGIARTFHLPAVRARLISLPEPRLGTASELPVPLTPLIGRARELAALRSLLLDPEVRLVTLTGPGGVGKTRLAVRLAVTLATEFADEVCFVGLGSVRDHRLVLPFMARAVGLCESGGQSTTVQLQRFLHKREMLLVLDNVEHVLPATPLIADLLSVCPRLKVLATSREVLRISGEHVVVVNTLSLPRADDPVDQSEAVRLFISRPSPPSQISF